MGLTSACLTLALVLPGADATSWPQLKGDAARSGDNPQASLTFPLTRTTAVRLPAPIYASPAVAAGRVYVQDARGHVACIDAAGNRAVWVSPLGGINNTSSPAVFRDRVFVGSTSGFLAVLDAHSGKVLARVPAAGGVITAPAVANDAVYFGTFAGQLVKIDHTGKVIWTFDGGQSSIVEFAVRDDQIHFIAGTDAARLHRLQDLGGEVKVLDRTPAPGQCSPVSGMAVLPDGRAAFQSYDSEFGRLYLGTKVLLTDSNDTRGVPSFRGGRLYRGDRCWVLDDRGGRLAWKVDPAALHDGGFHSSPALARNALVIGSEEGKVLAFALEGEEKVRRPLWQHVGTRAGQPNSAFSSSPAVVDGAVYIGGEDGILYGFGRGAEAPVVDAAGIAPRPGVAAKLTGGDWPTVGGDAGFSCVAEQGGIRPPYRVRWKTRVWSTHKAPMIVGDGKVFASGRMGPLVAVDAATGEILWKVHHPSVESRAAPTYADGRLFLMRVQGGLKTSPYVQGWSGASGGAGIWCHDAATGKRLWHVPVELAYHFNPDALCVHQGKVFACKEDEQGVHALALDAATGKVVWSEKVEGLSPEKGGNARGARRRFSGVIAEGLWCVSIGRLGSPKGGLPGVTLAFEPATGKLAWRNDEVFISIRTRVAARKGVLAVFNTETGSHALDARTGRRLWDGPKSASGNFYMHALTDLYLDSRGTKGIFPEHQCSYQVYVNGLWYSHGSASTNYLYARRLTDGGKIENVWRHGFLSNSCPSPAPAYGRLYYAPNGEGVVYCFEHDEKK